jgi:prepilin-type N-terminal cleavage/methylation domain-containing protein
MNDKGVSLVELVVVIAVIGILAVALSFTYQGWMGRYKVESAVKDLYSDLMDARARAMDRNATYLVDFPAIAACPSGKSCYRIANDTPPTGNGDGAIQNAEVLPTFPKTVDYTINGGVLITFDSKGLIYSGVPPVLLSATLPPVTISLTSTVNPDYDCINLYPTKIVMGQITGGVCNEK